MGFNHLQLATISNLYNEKKYYTSCHHPHHLEVRLNLLKQ